MVLLCTTLSTFHSDEIRIYGYERRDDRRPTPHAQVHTVYRVLYTVYCIIGVPGTGTVVDLVTSHESRVANSKHDTDTLTS